MFTIQKGDIAMSAWKQLIIDHLLKKQLYMCAYCGEEFREISPPELDHITPKSKGGEDSIDNFQLLHHICNVKKKDRIVECLGKRLKTVQAILNDIQEISLKKIIPAIEKTTIQRALIITKNNKSKAATLLEISRMTLLDKMKQYGIKQ